METKSTSNIPLLISSKVNADTNLTKLLSLFADRNVIKVSNKDFTTICRDVLNLRFTFTEFGDDLQKKLVAHNTYDRLHHIRFMINNKMYTIKKIDN